jgi:hypothetical protein
MIFDGLHFTQFGALGSGTKPSLIFPFTMIF